MIKKMLIKVLLLDGLRISSDAEAYRLWARINPQELQCDCSFRRTIERIPQRIIPPYKFYVNFDLYYFYVLFSRAFYFALYLLPCIMIFNTLWVLILPIIYIVICIVVNSVLTVIELKQIKKEMLEVYNELCSQMKMSDC